MYPIEPVFSRFWGELETSQWSVDVGNSWPCFHDEETRFWCQSWFPARSSTMIDFPQNRVACSSTSIDKFPDGRTFMSKLPHEEAGRGQH
jgi:hypothetical protein